MMKYKKDGVEVHLTHARDINIRQDAKKGGKITS